MIVMTQLDKRGCFAVTVSCGWESAAHSTDTSQGLLPSILLTPQVSLPLPHSLWVPLWHWAEGQDGPRPSLQLSLDRPQTSLADTSEEEPCSLGSHVSKTAASPHSLSWTTRT